MKSLYRQQPSLSPARERQPSPSSPSEQSQSNQPQCVSTRFSAQHIAKEGSSSGVLITVLMPCLNEARTLAACIQQAHAGCQAALASREVATKTPSRLREGREERAGRVFIHAHPTYEILIADNGSTDGSPEIAVAGGARVVHVEQKGYGAALLGGIAAARGRYIVMGDSDCSYDFGEVPRFIDKLEEGHDLVVGNRFAGGIEPGAMPWHHRYIGNPLLSGLGRLLYRTPCRDWHCGQRAFDCEKTKGLRLKCSGMEFASEMMVVSAESNMRLSEIPVVLHCDRRQGSPHLRSLRDGLRHMKLLVSKRVEWPIEPFLFALAILLAVWGTILVLPLRAVELEAKPRMVHIDSAESVTNVKVTLTAHESVSIKSLLPACGCTKAQLGEWSLTKGESTDMYLEIEGGEERKGSVVSIAVLFLGGENLLQRINIPIEFY